MSLFKKFLFMFLGLIIIFLGVSVVTATGAYFLLFLFSKQIFLCVLAGLLWFIEILIINWILYDIQN